MISVQNLCMSYRVPVRTGGLRAALYSLVHRDFSTIDAVQSISLTVGEGEILGFLGPNGAGKTTTLKVLSGILYPTAGQIDVLGYQPWRRQPDYLRQIAFIRGNRPLGVPTELTVQDALHLQQRIYSINPVDYSRNLEELCDMLDIHSLLPRQVRALSLGERMRCGIAWSLIYRPKVLFLDEPTLGLDVSGAHILRKFFRTYCAHTGAATMITSHYMADVQYLCRRVVLIDRGKLLYDGALTDLSAKLAPYRLVRIDPTDSGVDWSQFGDVVSTTEGQVTLRVPRDAATATLTRLLSEQLARDFTVEEPPLETVMDQIYQTGQVGE